MTGHDELTHDGDSHSIPSRIAPLSPPVCVNLRWPTTQPPRLPIFCEKTPLRSERTTTGCNDRERVWDHILQREWELPTPTSSSNVCNWSPCMWNVNAPICGFRADSEHVFTVLTCSDTSIRSNDVCQCAVFFRLCSFIPNLHHHGLRLRKNEDIHMLSSILNSRCCVGTRL